MGLIVAVAVPDGVAVASDGRAVAGIGAGGPPQVVSDTQQKIVQLGDRVAALIPDPYLIAEGIPYNLRSALEQVRLDIDRSGTIDDLAKELPGRLKSLLPVLQDQEVCGRVFVKLVGVRKDKSVGVLHLDGLTSSDEGAHSTSDPGLQWFGAGDVVSRVVLGQSAIQPATGESVGGEYHIPTLLMSLGDATALAEQLVAVTATVAQYVIGISHMGTQLPYSLPVGGHLHSATITRNGFRWVQQPLMLEHHVNPTDLG